MRPSAPLLNAVLHLLKYCLSAYARDGECTLTFAARMAKRGLPSHPRENSSPLLSEDAGRPHLSALDSQPSDDAHDPPQRTSANASKVESTLLNEKLQPARPRTAGGLARSLSRSLSRSRSRDGVRAPTRHAPTFEQKKLPSLPPCHPDVNSDDLDEQHVGLALGSPSHNHIAHLETSHPFHISSSGPSLGVDLGGVEAAKPKRAITWRKFGNLFRSKTTISVPSSSTSTPSYQLPFEDAVHAQSQAETQSSHADKNVEKAVDSSHVGAHKDKKTTLDTSMSSQNGFLDKESDGASKAVDATEDASANLAQTVPSIDLSLPDVHMDRYSVMFGTVLENHPSSNLLARRSKILDKLQTKSDCEGQSTSDLAVVQDEARLTAQAYPRRATSPTPSKSPAFSLFPQTPQVVPKIVGVVLDEPKQGPLQRSQTAPPRLSPMKATFDMTTARPLRIRQIKEQEQAVSSPAQTASTTTWGATEGSTYSQASTRSSFEDEDILFDIKSLDTAGGHDQTQYELVENELHAGLIRSMLKKLRSPRRHGRDLDLVAEAPPTPVIKLDDTQDEILVTQESQLPVPSAVEVIAPLRPSKIKIDQTARATARLGKATDPSKENAVPEVAPSTQETDVELRVEEVSKQILEAMPRKPFQPRKEEESVLQIVAHDVAGPGDDTNPLQSKPMVPRPAIGRSTNLVSNSAHRTVEVTSPQPAPQQNVYRVDEAPTPPVKDTMLIPISKYALTPGSCSPCSGQKVRPTRPTRSAPDHKATDQSPAVLAARKKAAVLASKSQDNLLRSNQQPDRGSEVRPDKLAVPPVKFEITVEYPTSSIATITPPSENSTVKVAVARQVSLSRKQSKKLDIAPLKRSASSKRVPDLEDGETIVERRALTPTIVNAQQGHRPAKSMTLIIEDADSVRSTKPGSEQAGRRA